MSGLPEDSEYDLFVSYAHADNEDGLISAIVEVLREIQQRLSPSQPWRVFFDNPAIRPMSDWERSIEGGLKSAGVMLSFSSPAYFASDWCQREWQTFRQQEQYRSDQLERIAVLKLEATVCGDEWGQDLARRQHVDVQSWRNLDRSALREDPDIQLQFDRLVFQIERTLVRLHATHRIGVPFQIPPTPSYFVPRPEVMQDLKQVLLGEEGTLVVSAVWGLGGVGKSTLVAALAHDREIRARFPDGILWATLGQEPERLKFLSGWVRDLGDHEFKATNEEIATSHLRTMLQDRQILLVVDDAWNAEDVEPFRVGGSRCRMVVTTREKVIARTIGARDYDLNVMTPEQAFALIEGYLNRKLTDEERPSVEQLASEVGHLPLALELAAGQVNDGISWQSLLDDLRAEIARLENLDFPDADAVTDEAQRKKVSLTASLNLSLGRLSSDQRERFAWLGVLPEDVTINQSVASVLWQESESTALRKLRELHYRALLLAGVPDREGRLTFQLHDLLHDAARRLLTSPCESDAEIPGQGLKLSEAHRELLSRYRDRTEDGMWCTLPGDGYIHHHLAWHMEQAGDAEGLHALLREETAEGRNGWYQSHERYGSLASFADDVARAWKLVDDAVLRGGRGRVVGLQWRYALMSGSLVSLAANIPPELIEALVNAEIWNAHSALVHAQFVPDLEQRVDCIIPLLEHLPESDRVEESTKIFQIVRDSPDKSRYRMRLCRLARFLSPELLPEALQIAEEIAAYEKQLERSNPIKRSDENRIELWGAIALHLPEEQRSLQVELILEALSSAIREKNGYAPFREFDFSCLCTWVPYLPSDLFHQTLEIVRETNNDSALSKIFRDLAQYLSENERTWLIQESLQVAQSITDNRRRIDALIRLIPDITDEERESVLQTVSDLLPHCTFSDAQIGELNTILSHFPQEQRHQFIDCLLPFEGATGDDWKKYLALASDLSPLQLTRVIVKIGTIKSEWTRSCALGGFAPCLVGTTYSNALDIAAGITDESYRARAIIALASHLPSEFHQQATDIINELSDKRYRDESHQALKKGASSQTLMVEGNAENESDLHSQESIKLALANAQVISDKKEQFAALDEFAPYLPVEMVQQCWHAAMTLSDANLQIGSIRVLAPCVDSSQLQSVVTTIQTIPFERRRAALLVAIGPELSPELIDQAWNLASKLTLPKYRSDAMLALAPIYTRERLEESLQAIQDISHEWHRAELLTGVAKYLPEGRMTALLQIVAGITDEITRAEALIGLAHHLSESALREAWRIATEICYMPYRVKALSKLGVLMTPDQRSSAIKEAWESSKQIIYDDQRSRALIALIPFLSLRLLKNACQIAWTITSEVDRADYFLALASRLAPTAPGLALQRALETALTITDEEFRVNALIRLAPLMTENLLDELLNALDSITSPGVRIKAFRGLALHLSEERLRQLSQTIEPTASPESYAVECELAILASHLPKKDRRGVVHRAWDIGKEIRDAERRARAVIELSAVLPEELFHEAFELACNLADDDQRTDVIKALLNRLPEFPESQYLPHWISICHYFATRPRQEFLRLSADLEPILGKHGGEDGVAEAAQAILDVGRWWP